MRNSKECHERREDIAALVLGELDPAATDRLNEHVSGCGVCRRFRDSLADQEETVRSAFDAIAGSAEPVESLASRFAECPDRHETQVASPLRRLVGGLKAMRPSRKILAAAAAIAVTFTGLASWLIPGGSRTALAFTDVLDQIQVFRPYSCLCTWEYEGQPPYSYREMHPSLSRRREERSDGTILVFDLSQQPNRILILDPSRKTATEETLLNTEPRQDPDFLRILANMRDGNAEDLGIKEVDGRFAHGFHKPDKMNEFTIWADPRTGLPIRIELVHPTLSRRLIMSDLQFNTVFDESLFSTTAPEGYTVERTEVDGVNPTEQHLIEGLRAIAGFLDNRFPSALDTQVINQAIQQRVKQTGSPLPDEEMKALQLKTDGAVRYVELLRSFFRVSDLTYAGDGVTLGDAATPILWWKPKESETYRVVYGDLLVGDANAEELRQPRKTSTSIPSADASDQAPVPRPYSCLCTWEYEGQPPYSCRKMHLNLSRRREERSDGRILVFDVSQAPNRTLILDPSRKTAIEETLPNTKPSQNPDFLKIAASLSDGSAEDLGVKEVDGQLAHGFHKPDKFNEFTVWVHPETGLPIRIELVHPTLSRRLIMSEFRFDVQFDESLFSTTAPAGYSVEKK